VNGPFVPMCRPSRVAEADGPNPCYHAFNMHKIGAFLGSALLVACAATGDGGNGGGQGGGTASGGGGSGGSGTGGTSDGGFNAGGGSGGSVPLNAEVYGHSSTTLYRLDPLTKGVTVVGDFSGCTDVIDIAIDKNNQVFGTTYDGLYRIDKTTAACTHVADGSYLNFLSFVPEGTLDPAGALTNGYVSSGDIVSVIDGNTYLTVKNYADCNDCIVQVNPATGEVMSALMNVGHSQVFGLAFWGGSAYGFSNAGELFEIQFNGNTVTTTPIAIPNPPQDLSFWGAGSSTDVPVEPPH
jgi:hypothetical protein